MSSRTMILTLQGWPTEPRIGGHYLRLMKTRLRENYRRGTHVETVVSMFKRSQGNQAHSPNHQRTTLGNSLVPTRGQIYGS